MSRNPVLNDKAFSPESFGRGGTALGERPSPADEWAGAQRAGTAGVDAGFAGGAPTGPIVTDGRTMSIGGVASSTLVMFAFLLLGGWYGWGQVTEGTPAAQVDGTVVTPVSFDSPGLLIGAMLVGLGIALLTIFKPKLARFTAVPYSLVQGVMLGMISHYYNAQFSGIVVQAILATFGVFLAMLVLYGLRILRATPKFTKGVIAATFGIFAMYLLGWVLSFFMSDVEPFWQSSGLLGIGISVVIVIVAALNLILDFDFIENGSKNGLPRYMDWYAAFGLVITLIWLYLEMLRLLSKLRQ